MKSYSHKIICSICLVFFFSIFTLNSIAQKKIIQQSTTIVNTGLQDRMYWTSLLYKIVYPVVNNMAEGTLQKNLPLEKGPNYGLNVAKVTYMEAVGRTLVGLAPWLSLPADSTAEGKLRIQLQTAILKGLPNIVNPNHPDFLNFRTEQQPIVDAAFIAQAFLRAPAQLWEPLDSITKKRFITEFKSLRTRKAFYNNWLLFSGITEAFLLKIGEQADPLRIDIAYRKMKEWYVGDGYYKDGDLFAMDYYNAFVIHSMMVDMTAIMLEKQMVSKKEYDEALNRMVRFAELQERMISPEGTYPVIGRSLTYRIAAFQTLAQVSLMEKLPKKIIPAQVRCAMTKIMYNLFDIKGTFSDDGWLQLGLAGHQPEIADTYTSTGSLYLCTTGFLALGLPANNIFWTGPSTDWTSKKAWSGQPVLKDYKVEY
jgi:hypothetical protein